MLDFIIVGAGLYGSVFAHEANRKGFKCLIIEKRNHTGGNIYCKEIAGINVHYYGAHIFHTSNKKVWEYLNQFVEFNHYRNSPLAFYQGNLYNLPFNMNTFHQLWGVTKPEEAKLKIEEQKQKYKVDNPRNLEEQALSLVGEDIYFKLIKGYTEKQWGKPATEIPAFIIRRIPLRFTYDNNYFDDPYQGIPIGGYNVLINKLLQGIEIQLNVDWMENKDHFLELGKKIIYTGEIDRYFNYCYGKLEYRSLVFEHQLLKGVDNHQGNAVVNYTDEKVPYTRILEHKHFDFGNQPDTLITKEYPANYEGTNEPYYPINDDLNNQLYRRYKSLAEQDTKLHFGGRLGAYKYYNMDQVVEAALADVEKLTS